MSGREGRWAWRHRCARSLLSGLGFSLKPRRPLIVSDWAYPQASMNSAHTAAPTPAFEVWTAWRCTNIPASVVGPVLRVYRATAPTARTSMRWGTRELGPEMGEESGKELQVQQGGTLPERRLGSQRKQEVGDCTQ